MRKNKWLIVSLVLFALGVMGVVLMGSHISTRVITHYYYEGKVLMAGGEYATFKAIIACDDVEIQELSVYSSENPLVVFSIIAPVGINFPWGGEGTPARCRWTDSRFGDSLPFVIIFGGLVGGLIFLMAHIDAKRPRRFR